MILDRGGEPATMPGCSRVVQSCLFSIITCFILITGETDVGKELFAKALHENSSRSTDKLVVADCGAIPEPLAESMSFGHEKGGFTGASQARHGLIKQAHHGTFSRRDRGSSHGAPGKAYEGHPREAVSSPGFG